MNVNERSWTIFKNAWAAGESRIHLVLFLLNRVPQMTYPLSELFYNMSVNKYGENAWYAPHNIWRCFWHCVAGFTLSRAGLMYG